MIYLPSQNVDGLHLVWICNQWRWHLLSRFSVWLEMCALYYWNMPSMWIYSSCTGLADIFLEKSQGSWYRGGHSQRTSSVLDWSEWAFTYITWCCWW